MKIYLSNLNDKTKNRKSKFPYFRHNKNFTTNMKKNLLITFLFTLITFFCYENNVVAQACESTIDAIVAPITAPIDADGNLTACFNGSDDALYVQDSLPKASLPYVNYVIEFSNGNPLLINDNGAWNSQEQGLRAGDTVKVIGFTYDIGVVDDILGLAGLICTQPSDTIFGIPCGPVLDLINGVNDGEPGLQSLNEALLLAASILDVQIFSVDTAASVLNDVNVMLADLALELCFNYTDPYIISITDCESNCSAAAGIATAPLVTQVCANTQPVDLTVTEFATPPSDTENNLFVIMEESPGVSLWSKTVIGFSVDGSFDFSDKAPGTYCFTNMVHDENINLDILSTCTESTILTINNIISTCLPEGACYSFGTLGSEYCIEVCNFADIDNDGASNDLEDINGNGDLSDDDTDGDGIPNFEDADDDGDGVPTVEEDTNENGDLTDDDEDEDGIPNYLDDEFTVGIFDDYKTINIYPNPSNGQFAINLPSSEYINDIAIYNYLGQSVSYTQQNNTISLISQQSGIYILQLETNVGGYITKLTIQ